MNSEAVRVELYAVGEKDAGPITKTMNRGERLVGAANGFAYTAVIPADRPAADYTPRLVPQHAGALVPLEAPFILWHEAPSWQ